MEKYLKSIEESANFLKSKIGETPQIAIVLGSGLGMLAEQIKNKIEIPYSDIPGFAVSTVVGHAGKLAIGELSDKRVLVMQGRFHFYEGYDITKVVFPIRVFKKLGINNLIITNAAGGVNRNFIPGDLMLITDHISFFAPSPLRGPNLDEFGDRFPDVSGLYNKKLIEMAESVARENQITLRKGVYSFAQGPMYETPAEIRFIERLGVDAVGMSTVPEVIAAGHAGMKTIGISCITNMASGILSQPLSHKEVSETANKSGEEFCKLVSKIVEKWNS